MDQFLNLRPQLQGFSQVCGGLGFVPGHVLKPLVFGGMYVCLVLQIYQSADDILGLHSLGLSYRFQ